MGAYLSAPSVEKTSDDFLDSEKFNFGVSRMQGWRISMEDAHCCVPELGGKSLFGVYDGHGGSEVALYCALYFTEVFKELPEYKEGKYEEALKKTFMLLDKVLLEPETIRELKVLADRDPDSGVPTAAEIQAAEAREEAEECEEDEMKLLHEEATMSIEELLERYGKAANETKVAIDAAREKVKQDNENENAGKSSSKTDSKTSETKDAEGVTSSDIATEGGSTKDSAAIANEASSGSESSELKNVTSSSDDPGTCGSSSTNEKLAENKVVTSENKDDETKIDENAKGDIGNDDSTVKKENVKVKSSGKAKPIKFKTVPIGGQEDEDFDADSDSDSSGEGFDSDEAVEGSSDSEEESDEDDDDEDEEEEEEDIDISELPSMVPVSNTIEEPGKDSGTTAVVAFLNGHDLLVANAGDSRCVLCRNGEAVDMSEDHKPEDEIEIKRIEAAGGRVNMQGRVNGGLNLSRAIGDHCYKTNTSLDLESQMISAMPDIKKVTLQPGDKFMVLACDGIWNVFSSQEVVDFVLGRLPSPDSKDEVKISAICEELMDTCIAPDTTGDGTGCDNMTCIIVRFDESWLQKSESTNSVISEKSSVTIQQENHVEEASIITKKDASKVDAQNLTSDSVKLNSDLNGKNGNSIESEDALGCKRQRIVEDENNDKLEQITKKQKIA